MAPASAGCERASLWVRRSGEYTYVFNDTCLVSTPWPESGTPLVDDTVSVSGVGTVGVKFTHAKPPTN